MKDGQYDNQKRKLNMISNTLVAVGVIAIAMDLLSSYMGRPIAAYKYAIAIMAFAYILVEVGKKLETIAKENSKEKKELFIELTAKAIIAIAIAIGNFLI